MITYNYYKTKKDTKKIDYDFSMDLTCIEVQAKMRDVQQMKHFGEV